MMELLSSPHPSSSSEKEADASFEKVAISFAEEEMLRSLLRSSKAEAKVYATLKSDAIRVILKCTDSHAD
jgi:hypothetical protein